MRADPGVCDLTVIVLTLNEARHLRRCLDCVRGIARRIVVVDCGSTDDTRAIAVELGADVLENPFENYARQFNWALAHAHIDTAWIMRLDADEYLTEALSQLLPARLSAAGDDVGGLTINLRRVFMDRWLRHGSLYPVRLLRIWRSGRGRCEDRWMDEHIRVDGRIEHIDADFVDHNLQSLSWWTEKHNRYASREAADLLCLEFGLRNRREAMPSDSGDQAGSKRWIKEHVYLRLPGGLRAFGYFIYRYVFRLGFLDGRAGANFHVLQGFWYRYLVDAKVAEVKRYMRNNRCSIEVALQSVLEIEL